MKTTAPEPGVAKATPQAPTWCPPLKEDPYVSSFGGLLEGYYQNPDQTFQLFQAAESLCHNDPRNPMVQQWTREVLQLWMNQRGESQAEAVDSFKLWRDQDAVRTAKESLCKGIEIDDEVGGAQRAFLQAKRELFDCSGDKISALGGADPIGSLMPWLDASATPPDELVRLFAVDQVTARLSGASAPGLVLYGIYANDITALSRDKALAMLNTAPYRNNLYARVIVTETLGMVRLRLGGINAAVKAATAKDPDMKEILIDAPARGIAAWKAAEAANADALAHSVAFEELAFGPSRKALRGCQAKLLPDIAKVFKALKHDTPTELIASINNSLVAGLLYRRYSVCVAADGDAKAAIEMYRINGLRVVRGPRAAAFFATIDAVGKIRADRPKFAITEGDVPRARGTELDHLTEEIANSRGGDSVSYDVYSGKGVVKTVKKGANGTLKVTFAKDKQQVYRETNCTTSNRIVTWDHDMRPIYERHCKGSVQTVDVSPAPISIPAALTEGVAAGKLIGFGVSNSGDERVSMPFEVYKDKQGKKLAAWYTIPL